MEDKPTKRGGGAVVVMALVAVLVLLPMLYVLSIGPVVWLVSNGRIGPSFQSGLEMVYAPLEWTVNEVPLIRGPIVMYAELWRAKNPTTWPDPPQPVPSGS